MNDGQRFLLNWDPHRRIRTVGWFDAENKLHVSIEQEVPDLFFTALHEQAADNTRHTRRKKNKIKVASVPHLLKQQWLKEINLDAAVLTDEENPEIEKLMKRKLNDNQFHKLRTGGGNL